MCVEWRRREGEKKLNYFLSQWQSSVPYLQKRTIGEIYILFGFYKQNNT